MASRKAPARRQPWWLARDGNAADGRFFLEFPAKASRGRAAQEQGLFGRGFEEKWGFLPFDQQEGREAPRTVPPPARGKASEKNRKSDRR